MTHRRCRSPARSCRATSSTPTPTNTSRTRAELLAPAPLTPEQTREAQDLAVRAFEACRCEAMARVDLFFEEPGRGFLVNEVNTIPGFTPISMYPRLWEVSGLAYPQLIDRLIDLALARHARRTARAGKAALRRRAPGIAIGRMVCPCLHDGVAESCSPTWARRIASSTAGSSTRSSVGCAAAGAV